MKTFAIMGCGHLGTIISEAYKEGFLEDYQLVGAYSRKREDALLLAQETEAKVASSLPELLDLHPDYLVETASIALLKEVAVPALEKGISLIPLSIGAFADKDFFTSCVRAAEKSRAKIHIPSGAVGGFDALTTISLMAAAERNRAKAGIHTHKGPNSLKKTPLYEELLQTEEKTVFTGSTKEAIALLPTKVNVAVASALATLGPENTRATITSVPGFIGDDHKITLETEGLKATVDIYSATSDIAGWSVVALLRNLSSAVQFF